MSHASPSDRPRDVTIQWPTGSSAGVAPGPGSSAPGSPAPGASAPGSGRAGEVLASGFPRYVEPPPSPKNYTSLLVGTLVVLVVVVLAVLGFSLVS